MQALGSYGGGRIRVLGLVAGLGSAMIVDGILEPMDLAYLPYRHGKTYEDYVCIRRLKQLGKRKRRRNVAEAVTGLRNALEFQYVLLGGGNTKNIKKLPPDTRLGNSQNAFVGGFRPWEKNTKSRPNGHPEKAIDKRGGA